MTNETNRHTLSRPTQVPKSSTLTADQVTVIYAAWLRSGKENPVKVASRGRDGAGKGIQIAGSTRSSTPPGYQRLRATSVARMSHRLKRSNLKCVLL